MQLNRMTIVVFLSFLSVQAVAQCDKLVVKGNRLLLDQASEERILLEDPDGIEYPRWSPSRDRVAYSRPAHAGQPLSLVITDLHGVAEHTIAIGDELGTNAILELGWLDDRRIWIEGHVNPSVSIFYAWNVDLEKIVDEQWGTWFAPSPDGKHLAYLEHSPHGAPHRPRLLVDGKLLYPMRAEAGRISNLTWSADGRLLGFVEGAGREQRLITLDTTRNGRVLNRADIRGEVDELKWNGEAFVVDPVAAHSRKSQARCVSPVTQ